MYTCVFNDKEKLLIFLDLDRAPPPCHSSSTYLLVSGVAQKESPQKATESSAEQDAMGKLYPGYTFRKGNILFYVCTL